MSILSHMLQDNILHLKAHLEMQKKRLEMLDKVPEEFVVDLAEWKLHGPRLCLEDLSKKFPERYQTLSKTLEMIFEIEQAETSQALAKEQKKVLWNLMDYDLELWKDWVLIKVFNPNTREETVKILNRSWYKKNWQKLKEVSENITAEIEKTQQDIEKIQQSKAEPKS